MLLATGYMVLGRGLRPHPSSQKALAPNIMAQVPGLPLQSVPAGSGPAIGPAQTRILTAYNHLPLMFEPNVGQADPGVKFLARGTGYNLFLTRDGAVMAVGDSHHSSQARPESLSMKLAGANPNATLTGTDPLPGKTNYLLGNDPSRWHHNVPQFARVRYEDVYPGINLLFYGNQGQLEYDFQVAPGADPSRAELQFDDAKQLELAGGSLIAKGASGSVSFESLRVYQNVEGRQQPVSARFVLRAANRVGFEIGPYDHSRELIIDPILSGGYSTYFGGSGDDTSPSIAVDNVGDVYLAGSTTSPAASFPQPAGGNVLFGTNPNVFVAKLDPTGQALFYLTFLGGGGTDTAAGVGVDGAGNAYLAGTTTSGINGSANFPTTQTNAYQTAPETGSTGTSHVFVSVLDPSGSTLKYSSYLSGNGTDVATGMTRDNRGNLFVTGTTTSSDAGSVSVQFPASAPPQAQPFQSFPRAPIQFFVTKVNTAAFGIGSITYSTYFGGGVPSTGTAVGGGIAVDSTGNIYFTGTTNFIFVGCDGCETTDFPILNAYQPCLDSAPPTTVTTPVTCDNTATTTNTDAFVAKLNPSAAQGSQLLWSTYLGGSESDIGTAIAIDTGAANIYVTGNTDSPDVTTLTFASYQRCLDTPVNPTVGTACPVIAAPAPTDAYVARLNNPSSGNMALTYFSYLGGSADDTGLAIAVDTASGALLTGSTKSSDLCTVPTNPCVIQSTLNGSQDAFLARINTSATADQNNIGTYVTYFGGSGVDRGTSVALDNNLSTYIAGDTDSPDFPTATPLQATNHGGTDAFVAKLVTASDLAICGKLSTQTTSTCPPGTQSSVPTVSAGSQATFTYTITNNGPDVATNITVTADLSSTTTGVPVTFNSTSGCSQTTGSTNVVCAIAPLQSGATASVNIVVTPTTAGSFNGGAVTVSSSNNNDPVAGNNLVTVSATATDFTVDIDPKNQSILAAGDTAVYQIQLNPVPVFTTNVSLSVSGLPNASSASFTSTSVNLSNGPATSTLNIITTARPITVAGSQRWRGPLYAIFLAVPGLALFGLGAGDHRRRKLLGLLLLSVLFGLVLLQPACSGGKATPPVVPGTPAGTYTLTLAATGGISHNTTFTLTVP